MLSESRKYKLYLTMAEQSTSQQSDPNMVNTILANVGTVVSFRTGNPADEQILLPLFRRYIETGEIANLSSFNFYLRLSAIHSQEPLSGNTVIATKGPGEIEKIIRYSREQYAKKTELGVRARHNSHASRSSEKVQVRKRQNPTAGLSIPKES
ncbi:hypothetical protein D9M68_812280 [compost metagenome]